MNCETASLAPGYSVTGHKAPKVTPVFFKSGNGPDFEWSTIYPECIHFRGRNRRPTCSHAYGIFPPATELSDTIPTLAN